MESSAVAESTRVIMLNERHHAAATDTGMNSRDSPIEEETGTYMAAISAP